MSESVAIGRAAPFPGASTGAAGAQAQAATLDTRRKLQLALGGIWLLDGILQFQPSMFTKAFPEMLAGTSAGNPAFVASPVNWSAALITHHLVVLNAIFATIQVALGLGIAWRPAARLALAASVLWSAAVWFLGEGLGGVLAGTASLTDGAPGAVILYALLAVLLWPANGESTAQQESTGRPARFIAGRAVGERTALILWTVLWASMALFALQPDARSPRGLSDEIKDMAAGQPGWLAGPVTHTASLLAGPGLLVASLLAAAFAVTAAGLWLPAKTARAAIILALVLAAFLWLAQGLGGVFTGGSTDPSSGPLLVLLALAYWPSSEANRTEANRAEANRAEANGEGA
jgi:hypothetical protein